MRRLASVLLLGIALAACGGKAPGRQATLVLDFTPNAVHAGIYSAIARHLDRANGVALHVIVPGASTDSIQLLEAGKVDFAILDIHDLAIARARGADLVGVMAVVERPLAAVIAAPPFATPTALIGAPVGITGVPSDTAVLDSIVAGAGGDPHRLRTVTIGYNAVADLLAGRVKAATAFWNDEGITLQRDRPGFHVFRVEDYGAPPYPELILCTTVREIRARRSFVEAVVRTLVSGYRSTVSDPARSAAELEGLVPGLDPRLVAAQLRVLVPAFSAPDGRIGALEHDVLERWSQWEVRFGIVSRRPDLAATFDPTFVSGAG